MKLKKLRRLFPLLALTAALGFGAGAQAAESVIPDGLWLGDKYMSGMSVSQATKTINEFFTAVRASRITVNVRNISPAEDATEPSAEPSASATEAETQAAASGEVTLSEAPILITMTVPVSEFGLSWSVDECLAAASCIGQTGRLIERYKQVQDMQYSRAQMPLSYSFDNTSIRSFVATRLIAECSQPTRNAACTLDSNGKVTITQKESNGADLDPVATTQTLLSALQTELSDHMVIDVPAYAIAATVTEEDLLQISDVLGRYETWFNTEGTNEYRGLNIKTASAHMNGTIIAPGETVSVDKIFQPRDKDHGYYMSQAYYNGVLVDSEGGGICQAATTLYQCLLQAELEIVERHNHSRTVSYVPAAQDATIDSGNCDLRFTNNTGHAIYIESYINRSSAETSSIVVKLHGVENHSEDHKVSYETVIEDLVTLPDVYVLDRDHFAGTVEVTSSGANHDAISAYVKKTVTEGEEVTETTMNHDYYMASVMTVTIPCCDLHYQLIDNKPADAAGNLLYLDENGLPVYEPAMSAYRLAKDYTEDGTYTGPGTGGTETPTQPSESSQATEPGGEGVPIALPDVTGKSLEDAYKALSLAGFQNIFEAQVAAEAGKSGVQKVTLKDSGTVLHVGEEVDASSPITIHYYG